jgi:membrane-bound lytic murein transglycosylase MltF
VLRQGVDIAWAVRKNNPELLAVLNTVIAQSLGKVTGMPSNTVVYLRKLKQLHAASEGPDLARFHATLALFQRYAGQYGFDELMLLAQSYQESRLDQNARSRVGAIGLMQLEPATGQSMGVGDIHISEANVHAGAKYMRQLVDKNFPDAHFNDQNRALFAFASYNAGPAKIKQLRKLAVQQKLDPDVWFNNVERVAAQQVGQETVRYVRNIYKYYVAYQLLEDAEKSAAAARASVPKTQ